MEGVLCFSCVGSLSSGFTKSLSQCSLSWLGSQWSWSGLLLSVWRVCQGCCHGCRAHKFSWFFCPIDLLWVLATCRCFSCELGDVAPNLMALSLSSQGNCWADSGPNQNSYLFIRPFSSNFPWNSCFHKKLLSVRNVMFWDRLKMLVYLHFGII